jgi:hypothetical protein
MLYEIGRDILLDEVGVAGLEDNAIKVRDDLLIQGRAAQVALREGRYTRKQADGANM